MQRREFIGLLGGAAAVWPIVARAQQGERLRRIGVLVGFVENDPQWRAWLATFQASLRELGWTDGRNVVISARWTGANPDPSALAAELIAQSPDVILACPTLQQRRYINKPAQYRL